MADRYSILFSASGLAYVRQVLGARPFDEVGLLIQSIEQQRHEQDNPPAPAPPPPPPGSERDPAEGEAPRPLKVVGDGTSG